MQKFIASSANAQLLGHGLKPYLTSVIYPEIQQVLRLNNLSGFSVTGWYAQQASLDVLRAIKHKMCHGELDHLALVMIGMRIVDEAIFPPFEGLDQALQILTAAYLMNHRNLPEADRLLLEDLAPGQARVINATPYPDDLIYGCCYTLFRRALPPGARMVLRYEAPELVDTDENTAFLLSW